MSQKSVISEEKFEEALDTIIERDFFPDLKELKEENNLLFPGYANGCDEGMENKLSPRENESLDQYLARVISEDDASFAELLQKDRERIRERCRQFFLGQIKHQASDQIEFKKPKNFALEGQNSLMYVPEGLEQDNIIKPNVRHANTRISKELVDSLNEKASLKVIQSELTKNRTEAPNKVDLYGKTILDPHVGLEYGLISTPDRDGNSTPSRPYSTPTLANTPNFTMKEASKRERIGIQLSEDIGRKKRDKRRAALRQAMHNLTPNTRNEMYSRGLYLSPAAQNLLKRTVPSTSDSDNIGLRSSYTPNLQNTPSIRGFKKPLDNTSGSTVVTPSPIPRK